MLKYIILFCIISFCDSVGRVGVYHGLVLVLHSPIISFFWQQSNYGHNHVRARAFHEHLNQRGLILEAHRWIINGLWPLDCRDEFISYCINSEGLSPEFYALNATLTEQLTEKWPVLLPYTTEENLWQTEFMKSGACISSHTSYYFSTAVILLNRYDIGGILAENRIYPGNNYELEHIVATLVDTLGKWIYVKCLPAENPAEQYLLQVQLCFTPLLTLRHCEHRRNNPNGIHECSRNRLVVYPGPPID